MDDLAYVIKLKRKKSNIDHRKYNVKRNDFQTCIRHFVYWKHAVNVYLKRGKHVLFAFL